MHTTMKNHRFLIWIVTVLVTTIGNGQDHWAYRAGGFSNDAFNDVAVGATGDLFVTGEFGGNVAMDGDLLVSQGSLDIVVARFTASGEPLWTRTFGGPGLDRGVALVLDPSGDVFVTGQFMGTVSFGTTVLTSQGGTQDMFICRLNGSDGAVVWAHQGGSADGVDTPNDIALGGAGLVVVTGEFRGNGVFDGGTITSLNDPDDGTPSVDIFVAAYDTDGAAQWLKHGAGDFADRGLTVVLDDLGNTYVAGQFSDTLTFDQVHFNAMFAAVFIVRFDPAGNESWFRIFGGGTYNQVAEMVLVDQGRLLLTGDVQGTVIFLDDAPDLFTAVAPRSSFLLEVDTAGTFLRQTTWGSEHVLNTRSLSVYDQDVVVYGRFQCQFTGLSAIYGDGTWLATGQHDLYTARFGMVDFAFKEAQQYGGDKNKVPGRVVHGADGEVVFCGAFDRLLVFPSVPGTFQTTPAQHDVQVANTPENVCNEPNYNSYAGLRGTVLMDAFLARGWVNGRAPYDMFDRDGADCDLAQRDAYIRGNGIGVVGPDSIRACVQVFLDAVTPTAFTPDTAIRHNAPHMLFNWNTGADTVRILVTTTGWYSMSVASAAGCWERSDSIHVTIDPLPAIPLISDDVVVNTNAPVPENISACEPFSPWLWATGIDPANTLQWSGPAGTVVGDSILATTSGYYSFSTSTPAGCTSENGLYVTIIPNGSLPPLEAIYAVTFPQDPQETDTIRICANDLLLWSADVALQVGGAPTALPYGVRMLVNCNGDGWNTYSASSLAVQCTRIVEQEGWFQASIGIMLTNAPCGTDTLVFWEESAVYVIPYQVTYPTVQLSAPEFLCPGDTMALSMTCTFCEQVEWDGPGIISNFVDTVLAVQSGTFGVQVVHLDTNGCTTHASTSEVVLWNPKPLLGVLPADGIICPNGIAEVFSTSPGTSYQWYGPLGPLGVDNDTISTGQQGVYYLEMLDLFGCEVTSDPVLLTEYATPYLNVLPDNAICGPGEVSTLQVVTTGAASLQWASPLSGNALQQVVDQPGIYTCSVQACGIVTELSVQIHGNSAVAELEDAGPFTLCPDETVELQGLPGMALYYWLPGPVVGPSLVVQESGTYTLVATDLNGCTASASTHVDVIQWTEAMVTSDAVVCSGTPVVLQVPGSGVITWYADAAMTEVLVTGNTLDLGVPLNNISVYVQQEEGSCTSALRTVEVTVLPYPQEPLILGPDTACEGAFVELSVTAFNGETYTWTTPAGTHTGSAWSLAEAVLTASGTYSVVASNPACEVPGAPHTLTVLARLPVDLAPDTMICPGGVAVFEMGPDHTNPVWHDGSTGASFATTANELVVLNALDMNGCNVVDSAMVQVFAFTQPLYAPSVSICLGWDANMAATGSGEVVWFADEALQNVASVEPSWFNPQPTDSAIYYVMQTEWLCSNGPQEVALDVIPPPTNVSLSAPTSICAGTELVVELLGDHITNGEWSTPVGSGTGTALVFPAVPVANEGTYSVVPYTGPCPGDTVVAFVYVLEPMHPDIGPDTTFSEGGAYLLVLPAGYTQEVWSTGSTGSELVITGSGVYSVEAVDAQGCAVRSEVIISAEPCDPFLPNVITPNNDGVNDEWTLEAGPFKTADLQVFNRFGDLVWMGDPSQKSFGGLHYLRSELLSPGVYFYVLRMDRYDEASREVKGYMQIIR